MKKLGLLLMLATTLPAAAEELAQVDKPAPMFRLPVYNGAQLGTPTLGLERYVGPDRTDGQAKVVVLSFMASFCEPCKREMPFLQKLHNRYKDLGLRIVVVAIDSEAQGQRKIEALMRKHRVTFPVLKDRFNVVARRWLGSQTPLPSLFIVRPDGTVAAVHRGYTDDGSKLLTREVEKALGLHRRPEPTR